MSLNFLAQVSLQVQHRFHHVSTPCRIKKTAPIALIFIFLFLPLHPKQKGGYCDTRKTEES